MKTKILSALKTEYANLGLSERALDGVASLLEKTVTDETGIDAAVKEASVLGLLKVIQSDVDTERQKASQSAKELKEYKEKHPAENGAIKTGGSDGELANLKQEIQTLKEEIQAEKKRSSEKATVSQLMERLKKEKNCTNEFILRTTLSGIELHDDDKMDDLVSKYEEAYNKNYKEAFGHGPAAFAGFGTGKVSTEDDEHEFDGVVARLRNNGVLEKPQEKK